MRTFIRSAAARAALVALLSTVLMPVLTERTVPDRRTAADSGGAALAERLANVAASVDVAIPGQVAGRIEPDGGMRSRTSDLKRLVAAVTAPAIAVQANPGRVLAAERSEEPSPSVRADRGGRVFIADTIGVRTRLAAAPERRSILRAGLALGDAEMRTALAGPQSTEGRVRTAMNFRSRHPDLQIPDAGEFIEGDSQIGSRFAALADAAKEKTKDDLLTLAYAPATGPQAKSSLFDSILGGPKTDGFIPPLGPKDHSWAATPLPASAYSRKEQTCLATGIYFEARGEDELGQAAVAQVMLNRVRNPTFPDTICGVVYQNQTWKNRCQFSFACDGVKDRITNRHAYAVAKRIAREVTTGETWLPEVGSATHYHATYVKPRWAKAMERVDKIGLHVFYRTFGGGWN